VRRAATESKLRRRRLATTCWLFREVGEAGNWWEIPPSVDHNPSGVATTTPGGKLVFHVFGALAEFERDLTRERTHAGLAAARARGRTGERPKKLADPKQLALARRLYQDGQTDVATICRTLRISRATLYRALK